MIFKSDWASGHSKRLLLSHKQAQQQPKPRVDFFKATNITTNRIMRDPTERRISNLILLVVDISWVWNISSNMKNQRPPKRAFDSEYRGRYFLTHEFFFVYFLLPRRKYLCAIKIKKKNYIRKRKQKRRRHWVNKRQQIRATFFNQERKPFKDACELSFQPTNNNRNNKIPFLRTIFLIQYAKLIDKFSLFTHFRTIFLYFDEQIPYFFWKTLLKW